MISKVVVVVLTLLQLTCSIPSPNGLGSDITILINNDILGPTSPSADSGFILLTSQSQESATSACAALGETLWNPELKTASIQPNLDYLTFEGKYSVNQQYWILPTAAELRTIDGQGNIANSTKSSPHLQLPAICTQSAPFSNTSSTDTSVGDTSPKWQVTVQSNNDYITGFRDRLSFRFLGIRYAPQPKRFTYSTPYIGTGGNVSALAYGEQCLQPAGGGVTAGSEDCLFLNVWTPYLPAPSGAQSQDLKPVMFWIYGGGYAVGTANDPTFDGGNIVSRGDVILVAINYRLATLGFLALDDGVTNGNYGLADSITALDWVRKNIHDFGGDLDRITIFGQSAGAASVRGLLASPKAKGKFSAAIPQSNLGGGGYGTTYSEWMNIDAEVSLAANPILTATNCSNATSKVDCLRAVPATTLVNLSAVARYLVVDGTYLTTPSLDVTTPHSLSNVHLMEGLMRDDGAAITSYIQTTSLTESLTADGFNLSVVSSNPSLFPVPSGVNASLNVWNVTSRVATDTIFRCIEQASSHASLLNNVFAPNQYFYEFNRSYQISWNPNPHVCEAPISDEYPYGDPNQEYFKCHSGELYYVFGTLLKMGEKLRDDDDLRFEQYIVDAWTSFARTYDPNPSKGFLEARGYTNTSKHLEIAGRWEPVGKDVAPGKEVRALMWPSYQTGYRDVEQCAALGWGLDYYLK